MEEAEAPNGCPFIRTVHVDKLRFERSHSFSWSGAYCGSKIIHKYRFQDLLETRLRHLGSFSVSKQESKFLLYFVLSACIFEGNSRLHLHV